ncbi:MAG: tetratricopeptide repeat protein [Gammaproteobacteria bacterium]
MAARIEGVDNSADGEIYMKNIIISSLVIVALLISAAVGFHYLNRSTGDDSLVKPGESVLRRTGLTVAEILRRAENGDAAMQYNLAQIYDSGEGVKIDHEKAAFWLLSAAERALPSAQLGLGAWYLEGRRIRADWHKGIYWLEKAAEQNDAMAQVLLAAVYLGEGTNVPSRFTPNPKNSFYWMLTAANNGFALAQHEVARMYFNGTGTTVDNPAGLSWLKKAAQSGWKPAMQVLGDAYEQGALGLEKDIEEAKKWHEMAKRGK